MAQSLKNILTDQAGDGMFKMTDEVRNGVL
jgi:hypothetical protein